jgi:transcriptional/translational regulatory protein YebC/TACO1
MSDADEEGQWIVLTDVPHFNVVKEALERAKFPIAEASLAMVPDALVVVSGENAQTVVHLIEALEDIDDVQKVYTNAELVE